MTTTFFNADGQRGPEHQPRRRDHGHAIDADGRTYCTSVPIQRGNLADGQPTGPIPTSARARHRLGPTGTISGYHDHHLRRRRADARPRPTSSGTPPATPTTRPEHVLTTTDPRGEVTTNCYYDENGSGQCAQSAPASGGSGGDLYTSTTPATTADPSGETTTYTYFPGNQADTTTTPAATTATTPMTRRGPASTTYSGTGSGYATPTNTSYTYNVDGSVHTMTDCTGRPPTATTPWATSRPRPSWPAGGTGLSNATASYTYFTTGVLASITYPGLYQATRTPRQLHLRRHRGHGHLQRTGWATRSPTVTMPTATRPTRTTTCPPRIPNGTSSTAQSYDSADENPSGLHLQPDLRGYRRRSPSPSRAVPARGMPTAS